MWDSIVQKWYSLWRTVEKLFEEHKLMRRGIVVWAAWLITVVVFRVTNADVLPDISAPVASVVTAVIGLMTVVIGFYQWLRQYEDNKDKELYARMNDK